MLSNYRDLEAGERGLCDTASDDMLIKLVAMQDTSAFETLFRRHYRRLFRLLLLATSRVDLAEELVNDTMLVVWRKAGSFRGEARVSTWLHGIALRRANKALQRRRPVTEPLQPWHEELPDATAGVEALEHAQVRWLLPALLAELSEVQRVAVELAYLYGYSMEEIAMLTDVPTGTVKARLFQARARLRAALDPSASPTVGKPSRP